MLLQTSPGGSSAARIVFRSSEAKVSEIKEHVEKEVSRAFTELDARIEVFVTDAKAIVQREARSVVNEARKEWNAELGELRTSIDHQLRSQAKPDFAQMITAEVSKALGQGTVSQNDKTETL